MSLSVPDQSDGIETSPLPTGLAPRLLAWNVLQAVAAGAYADAALERQLSRTSLQGPDRALATEIAYGAIRQRRLLDAWIDALGRVGAERQPPRLRWLLHVGLYQLLFCQRIPAAAAVSTSVELARTGGLTRLAPVVNALLRALLRRRGAEPADPWTGLDLPSAAASSLGLRHSLPDWLASALLDWLPAERAEAFARSCNLPPHLDLRCMQERIDREALLLAFAGSGVAAVALPEGPAALTLQDRPGDLRSLPGYGEGWWCVQDRNAQRIVPLLEVRPGMRVLDVCAAPGGKTTQIAVDLAGSGELWAVDRSEARLRRVALNAARLGLEGIGLLAADATELEELRPDWRGRFDRILLDAPCSGLGTLSRHPDARWRLQPEAIEELTALQEKLLEAMLPLLAPGGRLVYATCTVHPAENGGQIAGLLTRHPGLTLQLEQQWWPAGDGGDGFFVAVLEAGGLRAAEGAPQAAVED
ncbi:MAG: 16S rRNA (cytosine(967)-C(5))-methyltransferase [Cyanobium sp.]